MYISMNDINEIVKYKKHKLYAVWYFMLKRTTDPFCPQYKDYGGRGIKMLKLWENSVKDFIEYIENNLPSKTKEKNTLDRIDNDKGYIPNNLQWLSMADQQKKKRPNINELNEVDYINKKFENKLVIEWLGVNSNNVKIVKVRCDCGEEKIIHVAVLHNKKKTLYCLNCKQIKYKIELIGKKIGTRTITEYMGKNKNLQPMIKVKCDCGQEVIIRLYDFMGGQNISCVQCAAAERLYYKSDQHWILKQLGII